MEQQSTQEQLPPIKVLIVGGRNLLSDNLVRALSDENRQPLGRKVFVYVVGLSEIDVEPQGAKYLGGDITDEDFVSKLLHGYRIPGGPQVIFNTVFEEPRLGQTINSPGRTYYERNYTITRLLLEEAKKSSLVEVFVQSSSVAVVGFDHGELMATEENTEFVDLKDFPSSCPIKLYSYVDTKAAADSLVLQCNNDLSKDSKMHLRTCCLRLPAVYGPRDSNITIPLAELKFRPKFLEKVTLFDAVYIDNAIQAHMLAAKALLDCYTQNGPKVDGEAFFITDGTPMPFKDFAGAFRSTAAAIRIRNRTNTMEDIIEEEDSQEEGQEEGQEDWEEESEEDMEKEIFKDQDEDSAPLNEVSKLLDSISSVAEKVDMRTGRQKKYISRYIVDWLDRSRIYSVDKAKKRLKYDPKVKTADGIKSAVEWALGPQRKIEEKSEKENQRRREMEQNKQQEVEKEIAATGLKLVKEGKIKPARVLRTPPPKTPPPKTPPPRIRRRSSLTIKEVAPEDD